MGVVENLPCDCAAVGTILAIVGLILNTYSYQEITLAGEDYSMKCGWDAATFNVPGYQKTFPYNLGGECIAKEAYQGTDVKIEGICEPETYIMGIAYLCCGILGTIVTTVSVLSQAPKFAAKS